MTAEMLELLQSTMADLHEAVPERAEELDPIEDAPTRAVLAAISTQKEVEHGRRNRRSERLAAAGA